MTPFDPILVELAAQAKVRPPHLFHLYHALAAAPTAFDPNGYAAFAQIDIKFVTAMVSALSDRNLLPPEKPVQREKVQRGTRLPLAFQIPLSWLEWACEKRYWTLADARAEADMFVDFWQAKAGKDAVKLDWEKTFHNWVRNSRRANGTRSPQSIETNLGDLNSHYERQAALYDKLGRRDEARELRKRIGA